jgi:Na+/H+-translocating membrane pyrophosphatase
MSLMAQILMFTFVVIVLAWVLTRSTQAQQVIGSIGSQFTGIVGALMPTAKQG